MIRIFILPDLQTFLICLFPLCSTNLLQALHSHFSLFTLPNWLPFLLCFAARSLICSISCHFRHIFMLMLRDLCVCFPALFAIDRKMWRIYFCAFVSHTNAVLRRELCFGRRQPIAIPIAWLLPSQKAIPNQSVFCLRVWMQGNSIELDCKMPRPFPCFVSKNVHWTTLIQFASIPISTNLYW